MMRGQTFNVASYVLLLQITITVAIYIAPKSKSEDNNYYHKNKGVKKIMYNAFSKYCMWKLTRYQLKYSFLFQWVKSSII